MLDLVQFMQEWLLELLGGYRHNVLITNLILFLFTFLVYWLVYVLVFRGFRALSRRLLKEESQVPTRRPEWESPAND